MNLANSQFQHYMRSEVFDIPYLFQNLMEKEIKDYDEETHFYGTQMIHNYYSKADPGTSCCLRKMSDYCTAHFAEQLRLSGMYEC
jgi:hypothetical protein